MPRKYATGTRAWFICGRCGQRGLYINSVFDGYFPNLRVHTECWEDKHPQENLLKVSDPIALWRPSPEYEVLPLVLAGIAGGTAVSLSWNAVESNFARVESYDLYRSTDHADPVLLVSLPVTYDAFMALLSETLDYVDATLIAGHTYEYTVHAADADSVALASSNTLEFVIDPAAHDLVRGTEDDFVRETEDGDIRVTEEV